MFALLAIASCKDDFTVDDIQESPKLVVYCMPSPGDTTKIQVSSSVPVTLKSLSKAIPQYVNNATIVYSVNGQQVPAVSLGNGIYQVVAPQKTGDNIRLEVSAEGFTTVSASTVIPDTVPIQKVRVSRISLYDSDYSGTRPYDQVKVTFADDGATADYYAVAVWRKVQSGYYRVWNDDGHTSGAADLDSVTYADFLHKFDHYERVVTDERMEAVTELNLKSEPALHPLTDTDEDIGFDEDFYNNFYLFDDRSFNGTTYTLHLNADVYSYSGQEAIYQVVLYRLTPEYYHFIQAINTHNNSWFAQTGFSDIKPSAGNIAGGIGFLGGYSRASRWQE